MARAKPRRPTTPGRGPTRTVDEAGRAGELVVAALSQRPLHGPRGTPDKTPTLPSPVTAAPPAPATAPTRPATATAPAPPHPASSPRPDGTTAPAAAHRSQTTHTTQHADRDPPA